MTKQKSKTIKPQRTKQGINFDHCNDGGTFITNFSLEDLGRYQRAIECTNDPNLITCVFGKPWFNINEIRTDMGSLHYLGDMKDLSKFWKKFDELR